ncbi:MAG: hypothetical protein ACXWXZ_04075 [Candidatus Binatia bacterium]
MSAKTRQQKYRDACKDAGLVSYRRYVKPEWVAALDECLRKLDRDGSDKK